MSNLSFNVYDILGYTAAGAIVLVAATLSLLGELPTAIEVIPGIAVGLAAYVTGHVVSSVSFPVERFLFSDRWGLGRPERVLFRERTSHNAPFPWKVLFRRYYEPLPEPLQTRVVERASSAGLESVKDEKYSSGLLGHCEAVVQAHELYRSRIDRYELLAAFLRNSCVAFVLASVLLFLAPDARDLQLEAARGATTTLAIDWLALLCLGAAVVLLYRYVQMFMLWRREIFRLYAEAD